MTALEETKRFVLGKSIYIEDIKRQGELHCVFVRSPHAHATIVRIDASKAMAMPGVNVITGSEMRGATSRILQNFPAPAKFKASYQYWLPVETVGHVGEAVAAVFAENRETAEDAAELVEVDYETLPSVLDPEVALDERNTFVYPEWGSNLWVEWNIKAVTHDMAEPSSGHNAKMRCKTARQSGAPLEPGGTIAEYDGLTRRLTLWMSKQNPHVQRYWIAQALGLQTSRVRVISPDVGGGFGCKLNYYAEDIVVAYAAIRLGRPVKWIMNRREHFLTVHQSRDMLQDAELTSDTSGKILRAKSRIVGNVGVAHKGQWPSSGPTTCRVAGLMWPGLYDLKDYTCDIYGVVTNTVPEGALRGFGAPEATVAREMLMDGIGRSLGLDPFEVRSRNLVEQTPHLSVTGQFYDSGDYRAILRELRETSEFDSWVRKKEEARRRKRMLGIGIALYAEQSSPSMSSLGAAHEMVTVTILEDGTVQILTGTAEMGTQHTTVLRQIVAAEFGLNVGSVEVKCGDTDLTPFSLGGFGSRLCTTAGNAALIASKRVKAKVMKIAAFALNVAEEELEFDSGNVGSKEQNSKSISLSRIAEMAYMRVIELPPGVEPSLTSTASYHPPRITFKDANFAGGITAGGMLAVVEVDPETGEVRVITCVHVHDSGRVMNRQLVDAQLVGGAVMGIGSALFEEIKLDETGQQISGSFMDYAIPSATEIPTIENHEIGVPTPYNPLGTKGVGESGVIPTPAAIANAVMDALASAGLRTWTSGTEQRVELPLTPERVWRLLRGARNQSLQPNPSAEAIAI